MPSWRSRKQTVNKVEDLGRDTSRDTSKGQGMNQDLGCQAEESR